MDNNQESIAPLSLDLEEYRPYLAAYDLSPEKEAEFIETLWWMMKSFVDRAWGDDPVQHVYESRSAAEKSAARMVHSGLKTNTPDDAEPSSAAPEAAADGATEDS